MRVIAGTARSLPLKTPAGVNTRPTTDRIKETLFNMLQPDIPDGIFIDLFSGSGAIGIEAISRGAAKCYFVENDAGAVDCIKENTAFTKTADKAVILKSDIFGALHRISEKEVTVIFMDPPYGHNYEEKVLEILRTKDYITRDTILVVEASLDTDFTYAGELGFQVIKQKKYKTNQHVFLVRK